MASVGVYPGTFDPVHTGHVAFALLAAEKAGLDKVIFVPERRPRNKQGATDFGHRKAMLKLATKGFSNLEVAVLESDRFTVQQTLPELQERFGGDLSLLLGSDVVRTFSYRWPGLDHLLETMSLVIGLRHHDSEAAITKLLAELGQPTRAVFVQSEKNHAASSKVRGGGITDIAPEVQAYIEAHKLY